MVRTSKASEQLVTDTRPTGELDITLDDRDETEHETRRTVGSATVEETATPREDNPEFCEVCGAYIDENHAHLVYS